MRRTVTLLALAVLLAGCGGAAREPFVATRAAEPQEIELGWREAYPEEGEQLVFVVESLEVDANGWSAEIAVENRTDVAWEARGGDKRNLTYGLMLFRTGSLDELEDASERNALPAVREAGSIDPQPPARLAPGETWRSRISGDGALADGAYVRVVFGPLVSAGDPPEGLQRTIVWISDASQRL